MIPRLKQRHLVWMLVSLNEQVHCIRNWGGNIVPSIDEIEVFEPLFLLFIPNPFCYISPAALEESIVQG